MKPLPVAPYQATRRDSIVAAVCNALLTWFATDEYCRLLRGTYMLGLDRAAQQREVS